MKLVAKVDLTELKAKGQLRVHYPPYDVLVVWTENRAFAMEDACNHAGASLSEGLVEDCTIMCPMHGYVFDLGTGELLRPKGLCSDQRVFEARVAANMVEVYDTFSLTIV